MDPKRFLSNVLVCLVVAVAAASCGDDDGPPAGGGDSGPGGADSGAGRVDSGGTGGTDAATAADAGGTGGTDAGGMTGRDAGGPGGRDSGMSTGICGGLAEAMCGRTEWCDYPDGSACGGDDSTGVCVTRPMGCTRELAPVCGCDGADYSNACLAQAAGTDVAYTGMCTTTGDCRTTGCSMGSTCMACRGPGGGVWVCIPDGAVC